MALQFVAQLWSFDWDSLRFWKSLFRYLTLSSELSISYHDAVDFWIRANRRSFPRSQMEIAHGIRDHLKGGMQLHTCFQEKVRGLPPDTRELLGVVPDENSLPAFLRVAVALLDQRIRRTIAIRNAIFYPLTVLSLVTVVFAVYRWKVMPTFAALLAALGSEFPLSLRMFDFVARYTDVALVIFGILAVVFFALWASRGRVWFEDHALRIPFLRQRILLDERVRLLAALAAMSSASIPRVVAMKRVTDRLRTRRCKNEWNAFLERLSRGDRWEQSVEELQFVSPDIRYVLALLPRSVEAVSLLQTTSDLYHEKRDEISRLSLRALEPVLILLIGLCVASLVYAMYRPLFLVASLVAP